MCWLTACWVRVKVAAIRPAGSSVCWTRRRICRRCGSASARSTASGAASAADCFRTPFMFASGPERGAGAGLREGLDARHEVRPAGEAVVPALELRGQAGVPEAELGAGAARDDVELDRRAEPLLRVSGGCGPVGRDGLPDHAGGSGLEDAHRVGAVLAEAGDERAADRSVALGRAPPAADAGGGGEQRRHGGGAGGEVQDRGEVLGPRAGGAGHPDLLPICTSSLLYKVIAVKLGRALAVVKRWYRNPTAPCGAGRAGVDLPDRRVDPRTVPVPAGLGRVLPDVQRPGRSPAPLGGPSDRTNNRW